MRCQRLFLDVEWAFCKDNQILQLGGFLCDNNFKILTELYRVVRSDCIEDIDHRYLKLMGLTKEQLYNGESLEIVLKQFVERFRDYDEIVMWNEDAYSILISKIQEIGLKLKRHRVVFLQNILCEVYKALSFQEALGQFHVKYKKDRLHCSKYDSLYLKKLYQNIQKEYAAYLGWNRNIELFRSRYSNIIHSNNCRILKCIQLDNRIEVLTEEVFDGYKICKYCKKDFKFKLSKTITENTFDKPFEDKNIYEMCHFFGLKCTISEGLIFVKSQFSNWRIFHDYEYVTKVYHENHRGNFASNTRKPISQGFHKQNINISSLYSTLKYIRNHDDHYLKSKDKHQRRMDQLFDIVSNRNG